MVRKAFKVPRGICSHCDRETALMSDGRVTGRHGPCPGAGLMPSAVVVKQVVPIEKEAER